MRSRKGHARVTSKGKRGLKRANVKSGDGGEFPHQIRFRASNLDRKRLAALARVHELTPSETLRRLLAEEAARKGVK